MKVSTVTLEIKIPEIEYTQKELIEWLKYHLGQDCVYKSSNDLFDVEPVDCRISILELN